MADGVQAARTAPGRTAAEDVANAIAASAEAYRSPAAGAAFLAVIAEAGRDETLRRAVERDVLEPARELVVEGLHRAVARGELSQPLTEARTDLLFDVLAGALMHRLLVRREDADPEFVDTLTHAVLTALGVPRT